jgi:uncharacterized protein (DUF305 family)
VNRRPPCAGPAGRRLAVAAVALGCALAVSACGGAAPAPTAAASSANGTASAATASFGGTDLAWIEINIAMNEELRPLLALVPTQGSGAEFKQVTGDFAAENDAELSALRALHDEAGLPAENPHKGMPMPGMVTPEIVAAARAKTGKTFDAYVTEQIRAHLKQGVSLAESEGKAGQEVRTKELAKKAVILREGHLKKAFSGEG